MDEIVIWSVLGIGFGTLWFFRGFKRLRLRRRILGLATSKIRSMAMGTVELDGKVRIEAPLVDPIFSRPCAYFNITVREKRGSGKRSRWVTIYQKDTGGTPFFIEDSTGVARVVPAKAELHFPPEVSTSSNGITRAFKDDAVSAFLGSFGGIGFNSRKVTAYILREGQPLFLVGFVAPGASAPAMVKVATRDAARLLKGDAAAMKSLDVNLDGVVDAAEWETGVERKSRELEEAQLAAEAHRAPPPEQMPTVSGCPDGLFILANSQANLLSKLDWSAWLGIIGGPVVILASAAYLFHQIRHLS